MYDKKLVRLFFFLLFVWCVLLVVCIMPTKAADTTVSALNDKIAECVLTKDTAHQMAECARQLGYAEDHIIIQCAQSKWREVHNQQQVYIMQLEDLNNTTAPVQTAWSGPKLTRSKGVNYGPTGKETYYNLPMDGVVRIMRNAGFSEAEYPYWVRSDGCKMLGDYIMVAANLSHFPRGSVVQCSLGAALVCDTGGFASRAEGWNWLDIATTW